MISVDAVGRERFITGQWGLKSLSFSDTIPMEYWGSLFIALSVEFSRLAGPLLVEVWVEPQLFSVMC